MSIHFHDMRVDTSTGNPSCVPPGAVCRAVRNWASDSAGLGKWGLQWPADWPTTDDFIHVGLPFGPKPRLVLYHPNAESLRTQSPLIELEDSLTAFVRRTLGLDPKGWNIRAVKDQLSRLATADFRIGAT